MKRFPRLTLYIAGFIVLLSSLGFIQGKAQRSAPQTETATDSLSSSSYIHNQVKYTYYYPFIKYDKNFVEWESSKALEYFFSRLKTARSRKVKIVHVGDSHIQADIFTGYMRERLQEVFGYGGRGFIFPYAAARTHAAYDYRTWKKGEWTYAKNVHAKPELDLGITGATVYTQDSTAGFGFTFYDGFIREQFTRLKIYCRKGPQSYNVSIRYAEEEPPVMVKCNQADSLPYVEVMLPRVTNDLSVQLVKSDSLQNSFECQGLLLESEQNSGLLYNSVGINGAGLKSILRSTLFASQIAEMKPDLFVLDLGANDFYMGYYNGEELSSDILAIVDMVHKASPNTSVILSCSQDIFRRRRNVTECNNYASLTKRVAFNNSLGHYNYFQISGGRYSMIKWQKNQLAKSDKVHLTTKGYQIKGELFANALLNAYSEYLDNPAKRRLIVNDVMGDTSLVKDGPAISPSMAVEPVLAQDEPEPAPKVSPKSSGRPNTKLVYHKVKSGETLSEISEKYGVTTTQIKQWNRLRSTRINIGQSLKIYTPRLAAAKETATKGKTSAKAPAKSTARVTGKTHKVAKGETLWGIAQKYNTTVADIKKLNRLKNEDLRPGDVLKVK